MILCPYCAAPAVLMRGATVYPRRADLRELRFWMCKPCVAWVGCHKGTENPLGRLANAELRLWKQNAHAVFDPLWKTGEMTRHAAYRWLQDVMHLTPAQAHIGLFDVEQCKALVHLRRVMLGKAQSTACTPNFAMREYDNEVPGGYDDGVGA